MSETVSFRYRSIAKELEEQDGEWDVDGMQTNSRGKMEPSRIQMKRSKHGLDGVMGSRRFRHEDPSEEAVAKLIVFPQHRTWKENHTSFWREQNHTLPIVRSVVPNNSAHVGALASSQTKKDGFSCLETASKKRTPKQVLFVRLGPEWSVAFLKHRACVIKHKTFTAIRLRTDFESAWTAASAANTRWVMLLCQTENSQKLRTISGCNPVMLGLGCEGTSR